MSFALFALCSALAFMCMYIYLARRVDRRLAQEKLLGALQSEADRIVKELLQELNRVTDRNITLMEEKVEELRKILDTADKRILLMKGRIEKDQAAVKLEQSLRKPRQELPEKTGVPRDGEETGKDLPAGDLNIMDLYQRGIAPELIAKRLDVPAGEVELVISLESQRAAKRGAASRTHKNRKGKN